MKPTLRLRIAKWGTSFAVRLPAAYVRAIGARSGDRLDAEITPTGTMSLTPERHFDKAVFLKRLAKLRAGMAPTSTTVMDMRREDRY
jgi:antitoxin MazE